MFCWNGPCDTIENINFNPYLSNHWTVYDESLDF